MSQMGIDYIIYLYNEIITGYIVYYKDIKTIYLTLLESLSGM